MSEYTRAMGCVVGALVADAACAPLHWIYDRNKLAQLLSQQPNPEFFEPCQSPFYTITTGALSCAGDQAFVLLRSLVENNGFVLMDYKKRLYECFGPNSTYDVLPGKTLTKEDYPIPGPWRSGVIKEFLKNYSANKESTGHKSDPNGDSYAKMAVVAAMYAGSPKLPQIVEDVTRVLHDDDVSVATALAAAQILEYYIKNEDADIDAAVTRLTGDVAQDLKDVLAEKSLLHDKAVEKFGISCGLPGSFRSALHAALHTNLDYDDAIRLTICGGGDTCPRAMFVGALKGCESGLEGIPELWIERCLVGANIVSLAEQLVDCHGTRL